MAAQLTVIVSGGGLRSLTATAVALSETSAANIVLLHLRDGRVNTAQRSEHLRQQANHFSINRVVEIELPHVQSAAFVPVNQDGGTTALIRPQTLLVALSQAIRLKAHRLVSPVQINGDFTTITRATEEVVLIEQLIKLEQQQTPVIDMPLLDLTDQQMIELGCQLGVPWDCAWTCMMTQEHPCGVCAACQHRHAAFESAGVVDPMSKQPAMQ
jgi:7-cyano-7-deazaguanine synthase in queuosine biosynthesis